MLSACKRSCRFKVGWIVGIRCQSTFEPSSPKRKQIVQTTRRGESTILTRLTLDPHAQKEDKNVWVVTRTQQQDGNQAQDDILTSSISLPVETPGAWGFIVHRAKATVSVVKNTLIMTFLPKNYPDSVTRDYLPYTLWHFAHSVSGTITGTLSTQALLQALGMGVGASIGIAATTNWIIKDGFGLLGGVLYAAFFGSRFDSQARRYRFLAAGSIQAATLAELLTPLVPQFFLPMASLSNVGKNIGWLAASATKASMHKGFAKEDNLGDITAKSGAQATLAGLVGTTGGIAISWLVAVASGGGTAVSPWVMFYAFAPLSAFNLWSAYRANLAVTTRSFNIERCELAIAETVGKICEGGDVGEAVKNILSPKEVGGKETFVMPFRSTYRIGLEVEPPIAKTLDRMDFETSMAFLNGASRTGGEMYRIFMAEEGKIYLWFVEGSAPEDHIKGFYHACVVRQMMEGGTTVVKPGEVTEKAGRVVESTYEFVLRRFKELGWVTEYTHLADRNARIHIG